MVLEIPELLALAHQALEQLRRLPLVAADSVLELLNACQDLIQSDLVGPEHRPPAVRREAIAVYPDNIDIRCAASDAFLEDLRTLVDHDVHATLEDFLVADRA